MERLIIATCNKDGVDVVYEGIATYHDDRLGKDFVVYTDRTRDDKGNLKIYYSLYKKVNDVFTFVAFETEEEKQLGMALAKEVMETLNRTKKN